MQALSVQPSERVVDGTLGYEGHAAELLKAVQPGGCLLGVDQDPIELPTTETRLRSAGFPAESLQCERTNFVALRAVLGKIGWHDGADAILRVEQLGLKSLSTLGVFLITRELTPQERTGKQAQQVRAHRHRRSIMTEIIV